MNKEMKNCPVCDSEVYIDSYMDCGGEDVYCVTCSTCQLEGGRFKSAEEAIEAWNNRGEYTTEMRIKTINKIADILCNKYNATIDRISVAGDKVHFYMYLIDSDDDCYWNLTGTVRTTDSHLLGYFHIEKADDPAACLVWDTTCSLGEDPELVVEGMLSAVLKSRKVARR